MASVMSMAMSSLMQVPSGIGGSVALITFAIWHRRFESVSGANFYRQNKERCGPSAVREIQTNTKYERERFLRRLYRDSKGVG